MFSKRILSTEYQDTLKGTLFFEIKSLIGRIFLNRKPILKQEKNYLHLGCGSTYYDNFVNADFFACFKFWKKQKKCPNWMLDFRYPLNCKNDVWDGVFTEHALEHLYPNQALDLLKELHRTMKVGSYIRIVVPDLEQCVADYSVYLSEVVNTGESKREYNSEDIEGAELIWSLTQNWLHRSVWDAQLLSEFLESAGFCNIKKVEFMLGADSTIIKDTDARKNRSLYIEAQK